MSKSIKRPSLGLPFRTSPHPCRSSNHHHHGPCQLPLRASYMPGGIHQRFRQKTPSSQGPQGCWSHTRYDNQSPHVTFWYRTSGLASLAQGRRPSTTVSCYRSPTAPLYLVNLRALDSTAYQTEKLQSIVDTVITFDDKEVTFQCLFLYLREILRASKLRRKRRN